VKIVRVLVVEGDENMVLLELAKTKVAPGNPLQWSNGVTITEVIRAENGWTGDDV